MQVNWNEIKEAYIKTHVTQRELALRYGVSQAAIARRSVSEGWYQKKCEKQTCAEERASLNNTPDPREQLKRLTYTLLKKTERAILSLSDTDTDTGKLRQLVQSVKDLRDIVKSNASASDVGQLERIIEGLCEE